MAEQLALSVKEAAALLGVNPLTVYEAINRDEFPHVRVGRRVLIPRSALQKWLDQK